MTTIPDSLFNTYYLSTQVIFIVTLILFYYKDITHYLEDFKKNGIKYLKFGINIWFKGLFVMIISNMIISSFSPITMPENEQAIRETLSISPLFIIISSVIIAPILEEILFRKTLFDIIKNKNAYVIISGLVFGAFHIIGIGESLYSWLYVIPYAALGVAFAYTYVKTNNLVTSICLHSFHNLITVVQLLLLI
jgi:membrane protease YdiL (CAAX protease family)